MLIYFDLENVIFFKSIQDEGSNMTQGEGQICLNGIYKFVSMGMP